MDLDLVFLGTSGSVPTARRAPSALLVRRGGDRLLFDCGEGTQRQLLRSAIGLVELDEVFLTHYHADHYLGLPGMMKTFALRGRDTPMTIYGPRGLADLFSSLRRVFGKLTYPLRARRARPRRHARARRLLPVHLPGGARHPGGRLRARRERAARSLRRGRGRRARRTRRAALRRAPERRDGDAAGRVDGRARAGARSRARRPEGRDHRGHASRGERARGGRLGGGARPRRQLRRGRARAGRRDRPRHRRPPPRSSPGRRA